MACNDCEDYIATGAIGPQGPKGDTGATGATGPQGPAGLDADEIPLVWAAIPLTNGYTAVTGYTPEYAFWNGLLYFRGRLEQTQPTSAAFTLMNFGFTKQVITWVADKVSSISKGSVLENLTFEAADGGVRPTDNGTHYILLDSMPPVSIQ